MNWSFGPGPGDVIVECELCHGVIALLRGVPVWAGPALVAAHMNQAHHRVQTIGVITRIRQHATDVEPVIGSFRVDDLDKWLS